MTLKIKPFERIYDRSKFCCGEESLDAYLKKQASQDIERKVASVFILVDEPDVNILAYYTLSSYIIEIENLTDDFAKKLPRYPMLPAILLGRLAVDCNHQGKGLGAIMLLDALKRSLNYSRHIGSLAIVVEALDQDALAFYKKYNFQPFKQNPMALYLPMKTIEKLNL